MIGPDPTGHVSPNLTVIKSLCYFEVQNYDFSAPLKSFSNFLSVSDRLDINRAVTLEDLTVGVTVMLSSFSGERDVLKLGGIDMMVPCGFLLFCLRRIEWFYP